MTSRIVQFSRLAGTDINFSNRQYQVPAVMNGPDENGDFHELFAECLRKLQNERSPDPYGPIYPTIVLGWHEQIGMSPGRLWYGWNHII